MKDIKKNYVSAEDVQRFHKDGVVVIRGAFKDWIPELLKGAQRNVEVPSPRGITHVNAEGGGKFFEDFYNWDKIPEYKHFIENSPMAELAAQIMDSSTVQFFHDHYLDKEGGTPIATPWHQDMPYYFVEGSQTISFWIPLNPVPKEYSLKCLAKSHLLPKLIRPTSWSTDESFYADDSSFMDMPDIPENDENIRVWDIEPGDAVAFNFKTIHGANANKEQVHRRTLSFRLVGDDVRYYQRPGRTSPDFPDLKQQTGEKLRSELFPVLR